MAKTVTLSSTRRVSFAGVGRDQDKVYAVTERAGGVLVLRPVTPTTTTLARGAV